MLVVIQLFAFNYVFNDIKIINRLEAERNSKVHRGARNAGSLPEARQAVFAEQGRAKCGSVAGFAHALTLPLVAPTRLNPSRFFEI